jgi:hypothetical protein
VTSSMMGWGCDKRTIFVVICDTDISYQLTKSWWWS